MPSSNITPVIMCGGSGTRLWPLSVPDRPKQFHALVAAETLFQQTVRRAAALGSVNPQLIVCNQAHRFSVAEELQQIGVAAGAILLEPEGRNTAAAVAVAALTALEQAEQRGESDVLLLVLAADHVILDEAAFAGAVTAARAAAEQGYLVTFGIVPSRPETGYGYLLRGKAHAGWSELDKFVEKPDAETAEKYFASGDYLWNSGMFFFSAAAYLAELDAHEPAVLSAARKALAAAATDADFIRLSEVFLEAPSISIDYAVMERTREAALVTLDAGWSDVGSWDSLYAVLRKDPDGNVFRGPVRSGDCTNSYVLATDRQVCAIGLEDIVVIETSEAVLVMRMDSAQKLKEVIS